MHERLLGFYQANLNATGDVEMIGKNLIHKRSVMIAVAVIALMTITAGVAVAASTQAKNIEASGEVAVVGLPAGGTVATAFVTDKDGIVKSVRIRTRGEAFGGGIVIDSGECEETSNHSSGACLAAAAILDPATITSVHNSSVKLTVLGTPDLSDFFITGMLEGSLNADLTVVGANTEILTGKARLNIQSSGAPSVYVCLNSSLVPVAVQACADSHGFNEIFVGPVFVAAVLHVVDAGSFNISSESTIMKGDIEVVIDAPAGAPLGTIALTNGEAIFVD